MIPNSDIVIEINETKFKENIKMEKITIQAFAAENAALYAEILAEVKKSELQRFSEICSIFPGEPELAIESFNAGHSAKQAALKQARLARFWGGATDEQIAAITEKDILLPGEKQ